MLGEKKPAQWKLVEICPEQIGMHFPTVINDCLTVTRKEDNF